MSFMIAGLVSSSLTLLAVDASLYSIDSHVADLVAGAHTIAVGVIGGTLWTWMIFACRAGREPARVISVGLFAIECMYWSDLGYSDLAVPGKLLALATFLVSLASAVLLWRPASSIYFNTPHAEPDRAHASPEESLTSEV